MLEELLNIKPNKDAKHRLVVLLVIFLWLNNIRDPELVYNSALA